MTSRAEMMGTMLQMTSGYWVTQSIRAAAILNIAEQLESGPKHFEGIATTSEANPNAVFRLLRALSTVGIFSETAEKGVFQNSPMSELLLENAEGSLKYAAIFNAGEELYNTWGNIMHTMKTGENAVKDKYGVDLFEYYKTNPAASSLFDKAMTGYSRVEAPLVVKAYDFSSIGTLMDVGGGHGLLLKCILEANPSVKGILFDQPNAIAEAKAMMIVPSDRCQLEGGDFFVGLPSGADAIIMKSILHDWGETQQRKILQQCHKVLPAGGKLLIAERVLPEGNVPHPGKWMDMHMMVCAPGGGEHTAAEYEELLKSQGFQVQKVFPCSGSDMSVVEAIKI